MLAGVDHVGIEVNNMERAEAFYTQVLGMTVVMRLPDQVLLRCGGQNVALFLNAERRDLTAEAKEALISRPLGKAHLCFRASWETYLKFKEIFKTNDVPFHDAMNWGDHECYYFIDPDGNLLEIAGYKPPKSPDDLKTTIALVGTDPQ